MIANHATVSRRSSGSSSVVRSAVTAGFGPSPQRVPSAEHSARALAAAAVPPPQPSRGGRATRMLPRRDATPGRPQDATGGGEIETMDEKLELLSKVPLLAGLDRAAWKRSAASPTRSICPPVASWPVRAPGDEFFVILDGTVRIERDGQHLADLGPGDFFGELALLGQSRTDRDGHLHDGLPAARRRPSRVPRAAVEVPDDPGRRPRGAGAADRATGGPPPLAGGTSGTGRSPPCPSAGTPPCRRARSDRGPARPGWRPRSG